MASYLLQCSCGATISVEPRQAGERIRCDCGKELEVPTLRKMRELPLADPPTATRGGGSWGPRQGVLAAGLIAAGLFAAGGSWLWQNQPAPPEKFNAELRDEIVAAHTENWTPVIAWSLWANEYRPLLSRQTLEVAQHPYADAINRKIEIYQLGSYTCAGLAGFSALLGLLLFFVVKSPSASPA